ncbi:hypothetical protein ABZ016_13225 [Streptomyces sp. NPDC006372]|uniref:hypothetical protein n=1 Tax=Streptomyces sp. NPDC006372 TaxID=3155599 RepID=UPI0033B89FF4
MASRIRKPSPPTKPLVKQRTQVGKLDATAVVGELRQLHEDAEDPSVERMPADNETYSALLYAEKHASALRRLPPERQQQAALKRVQLWQYLRERAEIHQARAVADARAAGAEWQQLAPALAVNAANAAYNKAKRLKAAAWMEDAPGAEPVRRTPEAVAATEQRLSRERAAERRAQEAAQRRHQSLMPVAGRLLEQRSGLVLDEDAEYWLDEVAEVLSSCSTPTQMVSLSRYLSAAVRALGNAEKRLALPAATTNEAHLALSAAVAFLEQQSVQRPPSQ